MDSFLQYVAEDLIRKYGTDLSRVAVVFPNKRAALFLNEYLGQLTGKPIWSPAYITISELFRKHSDKLVADPIKLVCDLHICFTEQTGFDETLDHFYGWGQLLLSDFDDLDKNMADAKKVFANLRDIHELDDLSYLSEEQIEIIKKFFSNFSEDHNTELKKRFLQLWNKMDSIYEAFNKRLAAQGLAYEGALYREVAERQEIEFEYDEYVFVGFNLLQKVEQKLFKMLKHEGRAKFYWDFDHYYMPKGGLLSNNEAGHYIGQYLADFPNEFDNKDENIYGLFEKKRTINVIAAPTENAQARYISTWLREKDQETGKAFRIEAGRRTAIVLCNEGLLQTVIHCLPDEVESVNITTGYPLIQTPAASLVSLLLNLQTTGYSTQKERYRLSAVNRVLCHPYIKYLSEETVALHTMLNTQHINYPNEEILAVNDPMALLFKHSYEQTELLKWLCELMQRVAKGAEENVREQLDEPLMQESLFRMYTLLNRLLGLVESGDLKVDIITLQRLIGQLVSSTSVPFHGEPIEGLQVMGVLETRNLDFDHVLLLSCNEGNMPKGVNDTSFIPYSIRKAYGLTTIDHKVSIYSYYFHRLLQRAGDITILYNNATTDGQTAEKSRFMLQLMVESKHTFNMQTLQTEQEYTPFAPVAVKKTDEVMEILRQRFDLTRQQQTSSTYPLLTPTAINKYMRCQLYFYYNYVCGIKLPDTTEDDVIDNRVFGNIFHEAAQSIYHMLMQKSKRILASDIEELLKNKVDIERAVDTAIQKELFKYAHGGVENTAQELNGLQLINREVIILYLQRLLELDKKLAPFTIIGLECDTIVQIVTPHLTTTVGGRIDRLDQITEERGNGTEERIRVIDYKTGARKLTPLENVEAIFNQENLSKHNDYYLQTFLYGCIVKTSKAMNPSNLPVSPALLFIQHAGTQDYDPILSFGKTRIDDVEDNRKEFGYLLQEKIDEMFNPEIDFTPTQDKQRCNNCFYHLLCKITVLLVLFCSSVSTFGRHQILSPDIKSLQVVVNDDWMGMPIMRLGENDVLNLAFDELSHNNHRYIVRIEHCEVDWSPSTEIFESDWLDGFNNLPIDEYEKSVNTTVLYTHYKIQFPNDQCRLKMSGNYRLHVIDEQENEEVLIAEFRILENKMNVGMDVTTNTDLGLNGQYHQVGMTLNYNGMQVTFPEEQLKLFVMQNGREDNQKRDVKPNYITPNSLKWEHNRKLIFEAGNEYHKFEVLNPKHVTMGLERVFWDEDERRYHAFPYVCEPQRNYLYNEDADGAFYIRNSDNIQNDVASDYVYIHYKMKPARYYPDSQIMIEGKWTTEAKETYLMTYDENDKSYQATILQKMGYYNYQLIKVDADGTSHAMPEEGSFHETENRYQVLAYYKGNLDRTWRLVGFNEVMFGN